MWVKDQVRAMRCWKINPGIRKASVAAELKESKKSGAEKIAKIE